MEIGTRKRSSEFDQTRSSFHPELPDSLVPRQKKGFHLTKVPCCFVLQNGNNEDVLKLNATGALVWSLCGEEYNVGELLEILHDTFPDNQEEIDRDVYRVLDTLNTYEVIDLCPS